MSPADPQGKLRIMGKPSRLHKTWLLWLTMFASVVGVLPQLTCVCPDGNLKPISVLSFAFPSDCCCQRRGAQPLTDGGISTASSPSKSPAHANSCCHQANPPEPTSGDVELTPSTGCKKELNARVGVLTPSEDPVDRLAVEFASLCDFSPRSIRHDICGNPDFDGSRYRVDPCPPADLVISLCRLVV